MQNSVARSHTCSRLSLAASFQPFIKLCHTHACILKRAHLQPPETQLAERSVRLGMTLSVPVYITPGVVLLRIWGCALPPIIREIQSEIGKLNLKEPGLAKLAYVIMQTTMQQIKETYSRIHPIAAAGNRQLNTWVCKLTHESTH